MPVVTLESVYLMIDQARGVVLAVDAINRQQHGVHALGTAVVDKEGHIYPVDVTDEA